MDILWRATKLNAHSISSQVRRTTRPQPLGWLSANIGSARERLCRAESPVIPGMAHLGAISAYRTRLVLAQTNVDSCHDIN